MTVATVTPVDLSFDEMLRARQVFNSVTEEYMRSPHQLRQVLAKLGVFPPEDQLTVVFSHFENKVSFNDFCRYLMFLKGVHKVPEPRDADTLRAFVALGGNPDRSGAVNAEYLRFACKRFDLTIDIEKLIRDVDTSRNGTIDFDEFTQLWRMGQGTPFVINEGDTTRSFWDQAVHNAHNVPDDSIALPTSPSTSAAAANNKDGDGNNSDDMSPQGGGGPQNRGLTFPDAIRAVQLGVALQGLAGEEPIDEMPRTEQLENFLNYDNTAGPKHPDDDDDMNMGLGRRRSTTGGSAVDLRQVGGAGQSMRGGQSQIMGRSMMAQSHRQQQQSLMARSLGVPPLDTAQISADATPAEVLKAASELLDTQRKTFESKRSKDEMDQKLDQLSSARPPVIGGISISERRGEGIDLPEPFTIGGTRRDKRYDSPLSARAMTVGTDMSGVNSARNMIQSRKRGWR